MSRNSVSLTAAVRYLSHLCDRQSRVMRRLKSFAMDPVTVLQENVSKEVERALQMEQTRFPQEIRLPANYGKGMPERVVELIYARLSYRPGIKVLDIGHANAMKCHLKMIQNLPHPRRLTGLDIACPSHANVPYYADSIRSDIAGAAFRDRSFDLIWCISCLEHVGMDNSGYTDNSFRERDKDAQALREMLRMLKQNGTLLLTVPYGQYEDHGWLRNYDMRLWQQLLNVARLRGGVLETYFRHTFGAGWVQVGPEELQYVGYYDQANAGAGGLAVAYITAF